MQQRFRRRKESSGRVATMHPGRKAGTRLLALLVLFGGLTTGFTQTASDAEPWELAVCAPLASYPAADRERGGYDVEIAELLAEELGATTSYTWFTFDDIGMRDNLHAGLCDMAIGVPEGIENMLTTVAYLRAPYVFVTRTDSGIEIASLDDPQLQELSIGTYPFSLPSMALANRGITDNVREYASVIKPTGADTHSPILDALIAGEVDVAIVYGPPAAGRALDEPGILELKPVTPEVDFGATLIQLFRILTIGVRAQDEALRDSLNRALAHRWDDVMAILDEYGVPRGQVPRPVDSGELSEASQVGVIVPARTPASLANATVGDDALRGAAVAENRLSVGVSGVEPFRVLMAHAPSVESARRAAARLIQVNDVDALIGGYLPEFAAELANVATDHGVAYFNVGSERDDLRNATCFPTTFHVAPSASILVAATIDAVAEAGKDVYVIVEEGSGAEELVEPLSRSLASAGSQVVGSSTVEAGQFVFFPVLQAIREAEADTVLMMISSEAQELLLSQAQAVVPDAQLLGLATVRGQSRPFLQRFSQVSPGGVTSPRVVVWDPAVESPVNDTFSSRTGEPMEPAAWTTYAGIVTAFQAAQAGALEDIEDLRAFLANPVPALDVGKNAPVTFRESDGQMIQELYVVASVADASWGRTAAARTAFGEVLAVLDPATTAGIAAEPAEATCEAP